MMTSWSLLTLAGLPSHGQNGLRDCAPSELAHVVAQIRSDIDGIVLLLKE